LDRQAIEMRTLYAQRLDDLEQVRQRTGEPIDPGDQQSVSSLNRGKSVSELWTGAHGAGRVFLEKARAARGLQRVELRRETLVAGGDAGLVALWAFVDRSLCPPAPFAPGWLALWDYRA
jgi:hypothetical protein